jgi:hypothetical protein
MEITRSRPYRLYPTEEQKEILLHWENILRIIWNLANEQRKIGHSRPNNKYVKKIYMHYLAESTSAKEKKSIKDKFKKLKGLKKDLKSWNQKSDEELLNCCLMTTRDPETGTVSREAHHR